MKFKIKKADNVIVIAGKDKGKIGSVMSVLKNERVIVNGIAMRTKHIKANAQQNIDGKIIKKESSIHKSNIAIYNTLLKKKDKIKILIEKNEDGNIMKKRVFRSNNTII
jgi:large subunit ribosomal protein L24